MLSRIAARLFWFGRYVERADLTARLVMAHEAVPFEDPWSDRSEASRLLADALGLAPPTADEDPVTLLVRQGHHPASLQRVLSLARDAARGLVGTLPSEAVDTINLTVPIAAAEAHEGLPDLLRRILAHTAGLTGVLDAAMPRDSAYAYLRLGQQLERADMVARLLLSRLDDPDRPAVWGRTLEACAAREAYNRASAGPLTRPAAIRFLTFSRAFPRAVLAAAVAAHDALLLVHPAFGVAEPAGERRTLPASAASLPLRTTIDLLDAAAATPVGNLSSSVPGTTVPFDRDEHAALLQGVIRTSARVSDVLSATDFHLSGLVWRHDHSEPGPASSTPWFEPLLIGTRE